MKHQPLSVAIAVVLGLTSLSAVAGSVHSKIIRKIPVPAKTFRANAFANNRAVRIAGQAREAMDIKEMGEAYKAVQAHTLAGQVKTHGTGKRQGYNPLTMSINNTSSADTVFGTGTGGSGHNPQDAIDAYNHPGRISTSDSTDKAGKGFLHPENLIHRQGNNDKYTNPFSTMQVTLKPEKPDNNTQDDQPTTTQQESTQTDPEKEISIEGAEHAQEMTTGIAEEKNYHAGRGHGMPVIGPDGTFGSGETKTLHESDKPTIDLTHTKDGNPGAGNNFVLSSGTTTRIKGCVPGTGPCKKKYTPSPFDKTSQPGMVESGTGSSGAPRLTSAAVSNDGDSNFSAQHQGSVGGSSNNPMNGNNLLHTTGGFSRN